MALHARRIEQAPGPLIAEFLSLQASMVFFCKIQLHRQLAHIALQGSNACLIFGDDVGFSLFICRLAKVELRQPQLDELAEMLWLHRATR